ncbi:MAG: 23S rRNA (uracil(1939)-C(5))-methyltransferase RlmD [Oscillospiraceae bacterium]|nr:23S rRNA (uracil(1939)-C(5))-methyltransferase RlmD [Oscillospiraceae bacterium]
MPSVCVVAKKCGGCQYTGVPYPEQLDKKQKSEEALLSIYGRVDRIIGMRYPCFYRNKVTAAFGKDRKGNIICGTYQEGSHYIVQVDKCLIEDEKCQEIIRTIRTLLKNFKMEPFNEDTGKGLLRHVLVRRGIKTGEVMVVLVLGTHIFPSGNNFVKELLKLHPEISTVVVNINDRKTSMVLGEREKVSYGKGYITDELCGCRFRISPSSFYQINPVQTEVLYNKAIEFAGLTGKESVIDAYCGIGTIGMVAAKHAKNVIGIELNGNAVRDARMNAKENKIDNIEFFRGDAGDFMVKMAAEGAKADVVFMDPPRAGSDEAFLSSVAKLAPKKLVYISCNPMTLARDLGYITENGYEVKKIQPVDMFPFTDHCETVVLLVHKGAKTFDKKPAGKKPFDKKPAGKKPFDKKTFDKKPQNKYVKDNKNAVNKNKGFKPKNGK